MSNLPRVENVHIWLIQTDARSERITTEGRIEFKVLSAVKCYLPSNPSPTSHCNMHTLHIWSAVSAGDLVLLKHLIRAGVRKGEFKAQVDANGWTLLHHAVMTRCVELVKLVTKTFKLDFRARNSSNLTPLMLACYGECPVEMITHLMEQMGKWYDDPSPMEIAIFQNRIDLLKAVIPFEAKFKSQYVKRAHAALQRVTTAYGDPEILQCLLDGPYHVGDFFLKKKKGPFTVMEEFAHYGPHDAQKKVECFQILFNILHPIPNPTVERRYNVNDILLYALHSAPMTSLIPHLIETEWKWEHRPLIWSLYERLLPKYELLALLVLCECGPVTIERKQLQPILQGFCSPLFSHYWYQELMLAYAYASNLGDGRTQMEALELLEDFAAFSKTIKLTFFRRFLQECVEKAFCEVPIDHTVLYSGLYNRAVESMMVMYNGTSDFIIQELMAQDYRYETAILIFPLLRYCVTLLMRPPTLQLVALRGYPHWYWFVHWFGTWKTIESIPIGTSEKRMFTLKRFSRDAVREKLLQGNRETDAKFIFFERLQKLGLPKELEDYVRYSDVGSSLHFLEHFEAITHVMIEEDNL